MASSRGFEPPTCRLGGGCSVQLSYDDIRGYYAIVRLFWQEMAPVASRNSSHRPEKEKGALQLLTVQWRARQGSNLRPSESESDTLSS